MATIAERIIEIVNLNGGNMSAFARRINVTPAYISKLKNDPTRIPSDRTILDICNEFGINEVWLRTGEGPMKLSISRKDEIKEAVSNALNGNANLAEIIAQALGNRTEQELQALEALLWDIVYNLPEKKKGQDES